mmetsp:Transcript_67071/g.111521  ORF Transcript_67071/g.111521 Transcript_67071/m.111521 type:complete len:138 (-) Transcript_67071:77-490(-)
MAMVRASFTLNAATSYLMQSLSKNVKAKARRSGSPAAPSLLHHAQSGRAQSARGAKPFTGALIATRGCAQRAASSAKGRTTLSTCFQDDRASRCGVTRAYGQPPAYVNPAAGIVASIVAGGYEFSSADLVESFKWYS